MVPPDEEGLAVDDGALDSGDNLEADAEGSFEDGGSTPSEDDSKDDERPIEDLHSDLKNKFGTQANELGEALRQLEEYRQREQHSQQVQLQQNPQQQQQQRVDPWQANQTTRGLEGGQKDLLRDSALASFAEAVGMPMEQVAQTLQNLQHNQERLGVNQERESLQREEQQLIGKFGKDNWERHKGEIGKIWQSHKDATGQAPGLSLEQLYKVAAYDDDSRSQSEQVKANKEKRKERASRASGTRGSSSSREGSGATDSSSDNESKEEYFNRLLREEGLI